MSYPIKNKDNQKYKICIVEDDPMIREIYQESLKSNGYTVLTANDGEEGLAVIKKHKPDVAIIDIMMPKKDGISLIKEMQQDQELAKVAVIVATNRSDEETIKEIGKLQTKFYLEKALFKPMEVVEFVREVLHNKIMA